MDIGINNSEIMRQIGSRVKTYRLKRNMSQETLSSRSGCSIGTIKNTESGKNVSLWNLIGILRVFDSLDNLDALLPNVGLRPTELLAIQKKTVKANRKRASKS